MCFVYINVVRESITFKRLDIKNVFSFPQRILLCIDGYTFIGIEDKKKGTNNI